MTEVAVVEERWREEVEPPLGEPLTENLSATSSSKLTTSSFVDDEALLAALDAHRAAAMVASMDLSVFAGEAPLLSSAERARVSGTRS